MTRSTGRAADHPGWERPRDNGQFAGDPDNPPRSRKKPKRTHEFAELRQVAMRLTHHLVKMMPPLRAPNQRDLLAGKVKPPLPPEYDRLLSHNDGVIDAFNTLAQLIIRLHDKEKEHHDPSDLADPLAEDIDEEELDREIAAELDSIAARQRAAEADPEDLSDDRGETAT
jgi:hypothetical protein